MPENGFDVELLAKIARTEASCGFDGCPAVLRTSRGTLVIVGLSLSVRDQATIRNSGDVAITADEDAVEVPQELFDKIRHLLR